MTARNTLDARARRGSETAGRDTAEESYGDFQLVVDAIADGLLVLRDTYAGTLDEDAAAAYRDTFAVGVARRFRRYASVVADLEP